MQRILNRMAIATVVIALAGPSLSSASAQQAESMMSDLMTSSETRMIGARVYTMDLARAERFYGEVFGMTVVQRIGDYEIVLGFPDAKRTGVILYRPSSRDKMRPNGGFVIMVPDVDKVVRRTPAAGGTVARVPAPEKPGQAIKVGFVTDPDGSYIEILGLAR